MAWGYLSEFWDQLTNVGDYTIAWFQGVGNAVAGAIGSLFEDLIHHFYDIFYVIQYLLDNLQDLFAIITTPLMWIFDFVKGFFVSAFATQTTAEIDWVFPDNVIALFNSIPYWNVFTFAIGTGLTILMLVFVFKRLTSV